MMLLLGNYRFQIGTSAYQSKQRSTTYRFQTLPLLGRLPSVQFLGPGEDTLTLNGKILPHHQGGLGQVPAMRKEAQQGNPLLLLEGGGRVLGFWAIESVSETQTLFYKDGTPQAIEFALKLRKASPPN